MNLSPWALRLLDHGLMTLHLLVIGINLLGWIWPRTRRVQRWTLLLTTLSWLGLGAFYGLGYCFLTDWHWTIKRLRGESPLPHSFIQYVLRNKWGLMVPDLWVSFGTGTVFGLLVLITLGQLLGSRLKKLNKYNDIN